jgi:hypothetical protein
MYYFFIFFHPSNLAVGIPVYRTECIPKLCHQEILQDPLCRVVPAMHSSFTFIGQLVKQKQPRNLVSTGRGGKKCGEPMPSCLILDSGLLQNPCLVRLTKNYEMTWWSVWWPSNFLVQHRGFQSTMIRQSCQCATCMEMWLLYTWCMLLNARCKRRSLLAAQSSTRSTSTGGRASDSTGKATILCAMSARSFVQRSMLQRLLGIDY